MTKEITGAVIEELNAPFTLETVLVDDDPKPNEVLVTWSQAASVTVTKRCGTALRGRTPIQESSAMREPASWRRSVRLCKTLRWATTWCCPTITMEPVATV